MGLSKPNADETYIYKMKKCNFEIAQRTQWIAQVVAGEITHLGLRSVDMEAKTIQYFEDLKMKHLTWDEYQDEIRKITPLTLATTPFPYF